MVLGGVPGFLAAFVAPSPAGVAVELVVGMLVGFLVAAYGLPFRPSAPSAAKIAAAAVVPGLLFIHLVGLLFGGLLALLAGIGAMWVATMTVVMKESDLHLEAAQVATGAVCVPVLLAWLIAGALRVVLLAA